MDELRRRGHGLKLQDWLFEDYDPEEPQTLVENVVDWCKRTLAECRRPYGINSFDLTIAIRAGHESGARSFNFKRLKPIDLYDESFTARLLEAFGLQAPKPALLMVSAGFFSWGDAAHHALSREAG